MPVLETARLRIRPFTTADCAAYWRITDRCFGDGTRADDAAAIREFAPMMAWMALNPHGFASIDQPPYGDRAVELTDSGQLIGGIGYPAYSDCFDAYPALRNNAAPGRAQTEVGLFWAIDPDHQRRGYAIEAARAMVAYAFNPAGAWQGLQRIIATTAFDNLASQAVMRKLGMRLERNDTGSPPWQQVTAVLTPGMFRV